MNSRITQALITATGEDLEEDPLTVWKWWLDYNEMYQPQYNPEIQTVNTYQPISWRDIISCFSGRYPGADVDRPAPD